MKRQDIFDKRQGNKECVGQRLIVLSSVVVCVADGIFLQGISSFKLVSMTPKFFAVSFCFFILLTKLLLATE